VELGEGEKGKENEHQYYHKTSVKVEDIRICIESCSKIGGGRKRGKGE
jgi:hypothetical protein